MSFVVIYAMSMKDSSGISQNGPTTRRNPVNQVLAAFSYAYGIPEVSVTSVRPHPSNRWSGGRVVTVATFNSTLSTPHNKPQRQSQFCGYGLAHLTKNGNEKKYVAFRATKDEFSQVGESRCKQAADCVWEKEFEQMDNWLTCLDWVRKKSAKVWLGKKGTSAAKVTTTTLNMPLRKPKLNKDFFESEWREFADRTTLAGCSQLAETRHRSARTAWFVIFCALLGMTVWNTTTVVLDYLTYPVTTFVTVTVEPKIRFPAVTICNRNPVECSKVAVVYLKHRDDPAIRDFFNYSNCLESVTRPPLIYKLMMNNDSVVKQWTQGWTKILIDNVNLDVVPESLPFLNRDCKAQLSISGQTNDSIAFIKQFEFSSTFIPLYGICFVFNNEVEFLPDIGKYRHRKLKNVVQAGAYG
ncbi:unnamed protein product, partial [Notodromas monacha]